MHGIAALLWTHMCINMLYGISATALPCCIRNCIYSDPLFSFFLMHYIDQVIKDKAIKQTKVKANKPATGKADGTKKLNGKLTVEALADHDTKVDPAGMNLDDKLKMMRDKGFDAVTLSGADFTKLNLRFSQTALAKMDPQIKEACNNFL